GWHVCASGPQPKWFAASDEMSYSACVARSRCGSNSATHAASQTRPVERILAPGDCLERAPAKEWSLSCLVAISSAMVHADTILSVAGCLRMIFQAGLQLKAAIFAII